MGYLDDRKETRYECKEHEIIVNDSMLTYCGDISKSGIFLMTMDDLESGKEISLYVPSHDLVIKALVMHVQKGVGAGVKFAPKTDDETARIGTILENILYSPDTVQFKLQVLVADGNKKFRSEVKILLAKEGFSVTEAADGLEVIKKLNAYPCNALILNDELKKLRILDLIKTIKDAPGYHMKPIIVYTRKDRSPIKNRVKETDIRTFLESEQATPEFIFNELKTLFWD